MTNHKQSAHLSFYIAGILSRYFTSDFFLKGYWSPGGQNPCVPGRRIHWKQIPDRGFTLGNMGSYPEGMNLT